MKKVLLVDDNPLFLKMLNQAFTKSGFTCLLSESATDAITLLTEQIPDVILSDYDMPGMNGLEFRKFILDSAAFKDIPFVFLTYFSDRDLMTEGLNLQAVDYVIKDTPFDVIVSKINNLLETVKKQRELSEIEIRKAASALNIKTIPASIPKLANFEIDFWHRSYNEIPGGDFIDMIKVNERYTFLILGDVMGKKWMAWFFTFTFLSYIRAAVRFGIWSNDQSTASILGKVNEIICADNALHDILCGLSILMIDNENGELCYSGAGDLPLLLYKAATGTLTPVSSSGILLGLFPGVPYDEQRLTLNAGDQIFAFTDGIIDFAEDGGKKSDYQLFAGKLQSFLEQGNTFEELKDHFIRQIPVQVDDCSIIHIKRLSDHD